MTSGPSPERSPEHWSDWPAGEVRVWYASAAEERPALRREEAWGLLSADEVRRGEAFRTPRLQERFAVCRALLRRLLSQVTGIPAERIAYHLGPYGKPSLVHPVDGHASRESQPAGAGRDGDSPASIGRCLEFNVSHSGDDLVIALTSGTPVGIDVEGERSGVEQRDIVTQCFHPREIAAWDRLPAERREDAFYRLWTRKEAVLKALGRGLSLPLKSFAVTCDPLGECAVLQGPADGPAEWSLIDLGEFLRNCRGPGEGTLFGALAVPRAEITVITNVWGPDH